MRNPLFENLEEASRLLENSFLLDYLDFDQMRLNFAARLKNMTREPCENENEFFKGDAQ
jgi:hypothetical protein